MDQVNEDKSLGNAAVERKTEEGFTPGPWTLDYNKDSSLIRDAEGATIAAAYDLRRDEDGTEEFANARLIAAAPAMYEALRKCQTYVDLHTHEKRGVYGSLLDTIDAALALADKGPASQTDSE